MPPAPSLDGQLVATHFGAEADQYQDASTSGLWRWWRGRELAAVFGLLRPRRGERVLDAGSGAGFYTGHLQAAGCRVVSTDLAPAMVAHLRGRLGVPCFVADLQAMALPPRFDAVLCAGALEFCPEPMAAVAAMARGVRPGGRLVLMLPGEGPLGRGYRQFHRRHGLAINLFRPDQLARHGTRHGLRLEAMRVVGFNYVVRFDRPEGRSP